MKKIKTLLGIKSNEFKFDLRMKLILLVFICSLTQINANTYSLNSNISLKIETISNQEIIIKGTVTDDAGIPLPGASVLVKGTNNGASTDFDGKYTLHVSNGATTLVFSYLGFVTQEIAIDGQSTINAALVTDNASLDEVVVIGYGTQRKKDVAGAISTVKTEELVLSSSPSVGDVLRGKVSGLQITQNSAQPGGGLDIQIRGAGSVNSSNDPLIILDGFPVNEFQQPDSGNKYSGGTQSILNSFNPNDIASISVLKDASATSIYGARAANGVIILTTKKGKSGKVQVDYSTSYSFQAYADSFDIIALPEWMQLRNDAARENWEFLNGVFPYGNTTLEEAIEDPVFGTAFTRFYSDDEINNAGQGTNWLDLVTRDGSTQQHNLSLRGGTETTKYYMSGNLYEQKGVLKNSGFDRASLRFNLDQKLNNFLSLGMNLSISRINNENSQLGGDQFENSGLVRSAIQYGPHIQAIDEFGNYPINPDNALEPNPFSLLTITDEGIIDRTLTNFYLEVKPLPGLIGRFQIGIDKGNSVRNAYLPKTTLYGDLVNSSASINKSELNDRTFNFTLNYSKRLGDNHDFNLLAGYERQKSEELGSSSSATGFLTDSFLFNNLGIGESGRTVASSLIESNVVSFFGRLNYIYKGRYILTSTVRRDGSSVFFQDRQYGIFPSMALAWNVSEEPFIKNLSNKISLLKLRVGYGETGNSAIDGSAFGSLLPLSAYLGPDESVLTGVIANTLDNPDLKWETTKEINLGLDFGFFDGRISGSLEVYSKEISDLLQIKPLNSFQAVNEIIANVGSTESKGIEFTLSTVNVETDNFKWQSTFTFSKFKDTWKERAPDWKPEVYENVNDPIRSQFSYLSDGVMQIGDVVPAQDGLVPGQIKIKDVNGFSRVGGEITGDPLVDENGVFLRTGAPDGIIDEADIVLLGTSDPDFIAGFSNSISYKGFQLNFHFNGMFGRQIIDQTDFALGVTALPVASNGRNALTSVYDRWTPDNPTNTRPGSHFGFSEWDSGDFFLQDAWFIRLQNLSLSYTLPSKWVGKLVNSAAIRFDAQNLFVITPYSGVDPETNGFDPRLVDTDRDASNLVAAYPNVKTYTLGIDLKF
ncbi:SusC/RagA family TonB-linked outer membrane protein [Flavivirga jejuensis]|uniref:TonB-dependent receptor n=1 Tax=Flavivirga jejuensis TaxID=870487 RepID=A0ABT8WN58_9FLAO|nr:TonB-dependent receptor [Flavivirga jejuensis]MDO5974367.1 TonB-dependent receptor [Flavivirga jejuensis]